MKTKRKSSKPDLRQRIITVASRLMSEKGYKAASLDEISFKVGLHKSTFFHYFENKEELLLEVLGLGIRDVTENLSLILEDENLSPKERLREAIVNHIRSLVKFKNNATVYHSEIRFLSKNNRRRYLKARKGYASSFEQIIKSVKEDDPKCFRGLDTHMVTFAILGMCNWVIKWYKKSGPFGAEDIANIFYKMIMKETDSK